MDTILRQVVQQKNNIWVTTKAFLDQKMRNTSLYSIFREKFHIDVFVMLL